MTISTNILQKKKFCCKLFDILADNNSINKYMVRFENSDTIGEHYVMNAQYHHEKDEYDTIELNYCPVCGQRIDWEDNKEK